MTEGDRINEVYRGELGTPGQQAALRDRVNWIVAETRGRVLDVGCSQGMVALLCGRAGLEVLGIDTDAEAVEQARAELRRRPGSVGERVGFRVGDVTQLDEPDGSFDTVVLGELIGEVDDPAPALAAARRLAADSGQVVLTAPFGYRPRRDRHQAYYVANLVAALAPHLTVESLEIVDDHFRVVARPGPMPAEASAATILAAQESAAEALFLHAQRDRRRLLQQRRAARTVERTLRRTRRRERSLARRLRARERSRWGRLGAALAGARTARGLLRLPVEAVRALRKLPSEPPPEPVREPEEEPAQRVLIPTAEASDPVERDLRVELPAAIPFPEGPVARPGLRVATILDRFSAAAFRYEWEQVEVGPGDWRERLDAEPPQLLFVESAWKGNEDRWAQAVVGRGPHAEAFAELVAWCRSRDVPTVFWNKEDPPHFNTFLRTAGLFDHVLTTDSNCIGPYQEALGREDVSVLSFAAQPRIHNPEAPAGGRRHPVAFAGTYLARKHPARRRQMDTILGPARDFGLHIFSRVTAGESPGLEWPPEYAEHVVGSVSYERMLTVYKAYRLFLNVNTVTASPSMCARRVFEIAATGTPILSGYSRALEEVFGDDIAIARTPEEARAHLEEILGNPKVAEQRAERALARVLREHTYGHRVDEILRVAGIEVSRASPAAEPAA